jgi:hypothetical protein
MSDYKSGVDVLFLETIIVSVLNVAAVYIAAFVYNLGWYGILLVMVFASLFTAVVSYILISKLNVLKPTKKPSVDVSIGGIIDLIDGVKESNRILIVSGVSSLIVVLVLTHRFNFPMALGISLLTGLETMWWRKLLF